MASVLTRSVLSFLAVLPATSAMADFTVFESDNFAGRHVTIDRGTSDFGNVGFPDRARSAIVNDTSWEICKRANFTDCTILAPGRYRTLGEMGGGVVSARPLSVVPLAAAASVPGSVTFYEAPNFGGRTISASGQMPNLGPGGMSGNVQSAIVEGGLWEVCANYSFAGECTILGPGRYPTLGAWSNRIISARPASSRTVAAPPPSTSQVAGVLTFYDGENFTGQHVAIDRGVANFAAMGINDRARSVIVDGIGWQICVDSDFHGDCRSFVPGRYPTLGGLGGHVSSARPLYDANAAIPLGSSAHALARTTLYSGPNLTGRAFSISGQETTNLDGLFNDRASSLRVDSGYWIFCSDANFYGECRTFGPGEYPRLPPELDNRISSGRMISDTYPYLQNPMWR
ncbi:MAG: beta/gamma crystallin-related protein [Casimicrobiaceae bacterium]